MSGSFVGTQLEEKRAPQADHRTLYYAAIQRKISIGRRFTDGGFRSGGMYS